MADVVSNMSLFANKTMWNFKKNNHPSLQNGRLCWETKYENMVNLGVRKLPTFRLWLHVTRLRIAGVFFGSSAGWTKLSPGCFSPPMQWTPLRKGWHWKWSLWGLFWWIIFQLDQFPGPVHPTATHGTAWHNQAAVGRMTRGKGHGRGGMMKLARQPCCCCATSAVVLSTAPV